MSTATTNFTTSNSAPAPSGRPEPTPVEVFRAIHLDFEGTATEEPSLLGIACEGEWHAVVLEPALRTLAGCGVLGQHVSAADLPKVLAAVRRRAETEDRRLFAWSTRELDAITAALEDPDEIAWWTEHLENAIPFARRWARRHGVELPRVRLPRGHRHTRNHLGRYLAAVGYDVPGGAGPGHTAARIRTLRDQLARRGDWSGLTATAKGKWTKLCAHNRSDCLGMAAVLGQVATDLEGEGR
ncbi:hypothetical protein [Rhabdothermincola salaria]|uniref:hypothetical protein n=1 Tax=Rhabdothermincola salaria TaxID=2903142 RepID=UPI001E6568A0|nr:hypothetical protein [Rhabdothermincola salaria]MCD9625300.1 hypothetical protein [Rhabdothermincola salaria]